MMLFLSAHRPSISRRRTLGQLTPTACSGALVDLAVTRVAAVYLEIVFFILSKLLRATCMPLAAVRQRYLPSATVDRCSFLGGVASEARYPSGRPCRFPS